MEDLQKQKITGFIDSLIDNDYNTANEQLNNIFEDIIRNKIIQAKSTKLFEKQCDECDHEEESKGKEKSDNKTKSDKKGEKKKGKWVPPWIKKEKSDKSEK